MLPVASLPAAGLLLRFGQPDMLGADGLGKHAGEWLNQVAGVLATAGDAIFGNLALIFAMGVAIGMSKKAEGPTALAAAIGYFVFTNVTKVLSKPDATVNYGVLGGIIMGVIAAKLYDRYYRKKLPVFLAFFGGRRFVPIITAFVAVFVGILLANIYPAFDWLIKKVSDGVTGNVIVGGLIFGTLNRLLIPFGLHHILNSMPWMQFGEWEWEGEVYNGDIPRFLHHDPSAGTFQTGFFPIMMFALPAAALAFWHTANPENRKAVGGIMIGASLTAFLTGITEPIEFSFVYIAFPLYCVHAVLTGISLAVCNALDLHQGFSFSAGATDFLLNWTIATKPLLILLVGVVFAVIYYFLFRFVITKFNLKTPGREEGDAENAALSIIDQPMDKAPSGA